MSKIYKIRNVGNKHANFEAVTSTEALSLDIRKPKLEEFLAGLEVEDMHIPGHANTQTTRRFSWSYLRLSAERASAGICGRC